MKNYILILCLLSVLVMTLSGCLSDSSTNNLKNLGYSNMDYGFGLNPPEGWTIDKNDDYGLVRFYGPTVDEFTINIGISQPYPMSSTDTLESIYSEMIGGLKENFENFTEIFNNSRYVNGMDAYEILISYSLSGYEMYVKQVIVEKNRKVLIISFATLFSSYDTYLNDFENSLDSLTIIW